MIILSLQRSVDRFHRLDGFLPPNWSPIRTTLLSCTLWTSGRDSVHAPHRAAPRHAARCHLQMHIPRDTVPHCAHSIAQPRIARPGPVRPGKEHTGTNARVCARTCVRTDAPTDKCTRARTHTCTHARVHARAHTRMQSCAHAYLHACECRCAHMHAGAGPSITKFLERKIQIKGLCVEPRTDAHSALLSNRPHCRAHRAALGESDLARASFYDDGERSHVMSGESLCGSRHHSHENIVPVQQLSTLLVKERSQACVRNPACDEFVVERDEWIGSCTLMCMALAYLSSWALCCRSWRARLCPLKDVCTFCHNLLVSIGLIWKIWIKF